MCAGVFSLAGRGGLLTFILCFYPACTFSLDEIAVDEHSLFKNKIEKEKIKSTLV